MDRSRNEATFATPQGPCLATAWRTSGSVHSTLRCDDEVPLALLALQGNAAHCNTHTTRRCVASANPSSTTVSAWTSSGLCALEPPCLLLHFGTPWCDAPSSTYRPRRRTPQKPASSEDQLPPHRTISRPSVTCTDSLLHVYTHTLLTPTLVQSPPTCFDLQALSGSKVRR